MSPSPSPYIPLGPEPQDARPRTGPEPEDAVPKAFARAEKASPATVPGLAYLAREPAAARRDPPAGRLNTRSLLSALCLVLCPPASVLFGALALRQIPRSGERGRGLAVFGIALGTLLTLVSALLLYVIVLMLRDFPGPG
jgi:hypothetical protein